MIATRIYLPEPAAASFRLGALARAIAESGTPVRVLTTTVPGEPRRTRDGKVEVSRFPVLRDRQGYVRGYVHYLTFDAPLLFRLLAMRRPAVVVSEPPPTTGTVVRLVCALRGIPYVHYAADVWSDAASSTTAPAAVVGAVRTMERTVVRDAAAVLSVNSGVTERLESWGDHPEIVTVGNGIDTDAFSLEGTRQELAGPFFVYAGTASEIQGAAVFIKAFEPVLQHHPDATLVFIGLGVDRPALEDAAALLPAGRVRFLNRESAAGTAAWLRGATASLASVRPGIGYDYMIPTKMYASLACGTPVIFAGPGPSRTLIRDNGLGWAVDHDPDQVAEAMQSALESEFSGPAGRSLQEWVAENASLKSIARHAGSVVLQAARGRLTTV